MLCVTIALVYFFHSKFPIAVSLREAKIKLRTGSCGQVTQLKQSNLSRLSCSKHLTISVIWNKTTQSHEIDCFYCVNSLYSLSCHFSLRDKNLIIVKYGIFLHFKNYEIISVVTGHVHVFKFPQSCLCANPRPRINRLCMPNFFAFLFMLYSKAAYEPYKFMGAFSRRLWISRYLQHRHQIFF